MKKEVKVNVKLFSSMGSFMAATLSFAVNKSILWAIIHAIFSWLYVAYWTIIHSQIPDLIIDAVGKL